MLTKVNIVDNSGATVGRIIKILRKKSSLSVGNLVLVAITGNIRNSKIRKGQIYKGVLVTDMNTSCFGYRFSSEKGLVLVKTKKTEVVPVATRSKGFMSSKLKTSAGSNRLVSITKKTI